MIAECRDPSFDTQREAEEHRDRLIHSGETEYPLGLYRCYLAGHWHVGRSS